MVSYGLLLFILILLFETRIITKRKSAMSEQLNEYLQRVRTYKLGHWLYWFPDITPYTLASQGFICTSPHTIECHMCGTSLSLESISIVDSTPQQQNDLLIKLGQHQPSCIYDSRVTKPQQLYRITSQNLYSFMDLIIDSYRHTYTKHQSQGLHYPYISSQIWNKYCSKYEEVFEKLFQDLKYLDTREIDIKQILVIFGWSKGDDEDCLQCKFCGRKMSTKQFIRNDGNRQLITAERTGSVSQSGQYFDPVQEHRYFCVWGQKPIEDEFTNRFRKLSGWEMCLRHMQDRQLEVEKGWGSKNKFEQVTKVKEQFNQILDSFAARTREAVHKFQGFVEHTKPLFEEKELQLQFDEKISKHKRELDTILEQVEAGVSQPIKKVKAI